MLSPSLLILLPCYIVCCLCLVIFKNTGFSFHIGVYYFSSTCLLHFFGKLNNLSESQFIFCKVGLVLSKSQCYEYCMKQCKKHSKKFWFEFRVCLWWWEEKINLDSLYVYRLCNVLEVRQEARVWLSHRTHALHL